MAKASRSKKQPEFDKNELDDLIFSPAVGSGVGSHLLLSKVESSADQDTPKTSRNVPTVVTLNKQSYSGLLGVRELLTKTPILRQIADLSTVASSEGSPEVTTVGMSTKVPTVATSTDSTTVDTLREIAAVFEPETPTSAHLSTVVTHTQLPTVAMLNDEIRPSEHSVDDMNMSTVDTFKPNTAPATEADTRKATPGHSSHVTETSETGFQLFAEAPNSPDMPTMATSKPGPARFSSRVKLWQTADGELVPDGRVKQIKRAQDVINSAEESVYNTLWRDPNATDDGSARIIQAGYDYLVRQTRLARKTIQRIIAKLIDKDFIEVAKPADIYQRTSTVYRVFNYRTVLDRHEARGRKHVAKVGPGFSYVWELSDNRRPTNSDMSTVVNSNMSTVVNESPVTVVKRNLSTVVRETTSSIGNNSIGQTSSSSQAIYEVLSQFGAVDDDVLQRLTASCRQMAK